MSKTYDCGEDRNKAENKNDMSFWYALSGMANVGFGIKTILDGNEVREYYTENSGEYTEPGNGVEMMGGDWFGLGVATLGAVVMWRNRQALKKAFTKVARVPAQMHKFFDECVAEVEKQRAERNPQMPRRPERESY